MNTLISLQKEVEIISDILLKAASEPEFRKKLISNPSKVLEQYDISNKAKHIIQKSVTDFNQ